MIGKIVEVQDKEGLFLVVDYKNNEDVGSCSYDRNFWLFPYDSNVEDDVVISIRETESYPLRGMKNKVVIREDKKAYQKYGYSVIRGEKKVMLERIWEDIIIPTR